MKLKKDPTPQYTRIINDTIDQCPAVIPQGDNFKVKYTIPVKDTNNLNSANCPQFKPVIKIHKPNQPIRPLVNAIGSPTYKVAKYLDSILKRLILINNVYSIINSGDFAKKLVNYKVGERHSMISLDIVNLYTNIPLDELETLIRKKLTDYKKLSKIYIDQMMKLISTILKQNYFEFNGKFYITNKGLAMGAPLSSTLAQIYLCNFEETHIMNVKNPYFKFIHKYFRYVDDTFLIFSGTDRLIKALVKYVNSLSPHIKFTFEKMQNNTLNFLDLSIKLQRDGHLKFSIYRKPMTTDLLIPYSSNQPRDHKHAALHSLAFRAFNIPLSKKDLFQELNVIRYLACKNNFPAFEVNKIIEHHRKRKNQDNTSRIKKPESKFVSMKYYNAASQKIGNIFKNFGYKPAFKSTFNCKNSLKRRDTRIDNFNCAGVYCINCSDCNAQYIGKTERSIRTRFKEHIQRKESNVFQHCQQTGHIINDLDKNVNICHESNDQWMLRTLEKYEIRKNTLEQKKLLNVQIDIETSANDLIDYCCTL